MPVRVDPTGARGPTHARSRGSGWRRSSRGLYVPSSVEGPEDEQRIVEAAAVLPPRSGVTGWAAMRWAGARWFSGLDHDGETLLPVDLAVGDSTVVSQHGFRVSEEQLRPYDLTTLHGLPMTTHLRSVTFEMRHADTLEEAVVALDMAAYDDLVSVDEVARYHPTMPAWTGIPLCRRATGLADENSWSPRETRTRLVWVLIAELPPPLCNRPVFSRDGRLLGTPDLLDEESGTAIDYDGADHLTTPRRRHDRDREELFRGVGLEYVVVMAGDERATTAERMHRARGRARWAASAQREWTVDPPPWWTPTLTVDQRRHLPPWLRERALRYRRPA